MGLLERLKSRKLPAKAVVYARFSSDNQRNESIDAQVRAVREFARTNNIIIVAEYIDRAKSATTDDRPQFQQMIHDSAKREFELVLVHKLDRFARNRSDSIGNRNKLKRNGVSLLSVTEPLDDERPENIILESVLEGMAEYYSKNLAREVRKGLKENALKARHTGGRPPLGYDVDKTSKRLIINQQEATAVRLIFHMVIEGNGYNAIMRELNRQGYKTKVGRPFGKNSIYEILRNPKYKGMYVYNKVAAADPYTHTRNSHRWRDVTDMICIPDAVPAIITEEEFEIVQKILQQRRRHNRGAKHHKEIYLLTGKVFCGNCGCRYSGNRKTSVGNRVPNITYRCNNRARRTGKECHNKEVNRDYLEAFVLQQIEKAIFNKSMAERLLAQFQTYVKSVNEAENGVLLRLEEKIKALERKESKLGDLLSDEATSTAQQRLILQKLEDLEEEKRVLSEQLAEQHLAMQVDVPSKHELEQCFQKARALFCNKALEEQQMLINLYVDKIIVYEDKVEVILNLVPFAYRHDFTKWSQYVSRDMLRQLYRDR